MEIDKREAITASNLGPVVSLLTWIMEAAVVIAVGVKFTLSSIIPGRRNREDAVLFFATVFSIGFTVSMSVAVPNGIGRHQDTLSTNQLETLQKGVYSANILLVLVSSSVQASVLIFFHEITPDFFHLRFIYALAVLMTLFCISSFFVAAFPCASPSVWGILGTQCIDQLSFWEVFAAVNIVIEGALILFPVLVVYPLTMKKRRKAIVISCFAVRIIVIGAFVAQFYEAQILKSHIVDRTFHIWKYLLTTVFVQALSIITVCIPYIRNLLLGMESGMIQTGHFRLPSRQGIDTEISLRRITVDETSTNLSGSADPKLEESTISHGKKDGRI
ncbi:uncharacterized protein GGS22DRAFT_31024 [Annulohypoxylon maeteangense]|uniref:uncharacterized protein n=1 Tax=Annulohypoxylon maeteangense TaxID=1927788 RepID=UPI0020083483|nr:uncharacterized protein GGS22DRAFT_31024 [Annulohypoxylon maeteangense]KAI0883456.1 hypothetical protein GGS22DRAFT_31024 [Annulohypoxylon maeteangense]